MMPLSMVGAGEENTIQRIGGKEETKKFLETLGFVVGGKVTVVSACSMEFIISNISRYYFNIKLNKFNGTFSMVDS